MVMMFKEEQLDDVFNEIASTIEFPIEGFLIGGLAMIKNKMKTSTKDIDIVFSDEESAREFVRAAQKVGFALDTDIPPEYEEMDTMFVLKDEEERRIDVFVKTVLGRLTYTEPMKSRAKAMPFGDKLIIRISSIEDIFLYKSITSRPRDLEDMENLARTGDMNWGSIENEARDQPTPWRWVGRLYCRLGELEDKTGIVTPIAKHLEKEAEIAQAIEILIDKLEGGSLTKENAMSILGKRKEAFVNKVFSAMKHYKLIKEEEGKYHLL